MPTFSSPQWLLLAPILIAILWWLQKDSFAEGSQSRKIFWLVLRSLILCLLVAALAGLQMKTEVQQNQVVFLLDMSDSLGPEQKELALNWINRGMKQLKTKDQAGVVVFGSDAAVERFPNSPRPLLQIESTVDPTSSNLETAARLSEALLSSSYQQNIVILSDGLENAGTADEIFSTLRKKGIFLQALYTQPSDRPEAGLESIVAPEEVSLKQNFSFDVVASGNRSTAAVLQVYRNGILIQEGTLGIKPGEKTVLRLPQKIEEPGLYRYEFKLKAAEDFSADNNPDSDNPEIQKFVAAYRAKFPTKPDLDAAFSYDAVRIVAKAIESCRNYPQDLRDRIADTNYKGMTGDISFDANGDVDITPHIFQIKEGKFVPIQ